MRIAFYAPLKPPDHPVPSGDRRVGRALIAALDRAGHEVRLASRLRSWDGAGDAARQRRIERLGGRLACRLIRRYGREPRLRPELWLTYHLYHKAPDWLGPAVASELAIPYVVVEASSARKQASGRWAMGHAASAAAIARADALINLNGDDREGLLQLVGEPARINHLAPFIETAAYARAKPARARLAERYGLDLARPWLLAVAMMREGAKLASYRVLAEALRLIDGFDWQLVIVGDGPARGEVEALLAPLAEGRARLLGALEADALPSLYASADLYLWPAIHEAFGMAFLEAQAAGLPVGRGARARRAGSRARGRGGPACATGRRARLRRRGCNTACRSLPPPCHGCPRPRDCLCRGRYRRRREAAGCDPAAGPRGAAGMTQLALIRHAASAWSERGLIQGRADPSLSPGGAAAAAAWRVPAALAAFDWVASPLARASETARLLLGREVVVEPVLIEMAWGEWEGERLAELRAKLGAAIAENEGRGLDFRPPGGESPRDVQRRLEPWLARVALRARPMAAVTHKGVIRAVVGLATGWDFLGKPPLRLAPATAQLFELDEGGRPRLLSANIPLAAP